jgi:hypothetical protein
MAPKPITLTERRRRIREVRLALSLALTYSEPHLRDIERSDHLIGDAMTLLESLGKDLAPASVSGRLLRQVS